MRASQEEDGADDSADSRPSADSEPPSPEGKQSRLGDDEGSHLLSQIAEVEEDEISHYYKESEDERSDADTAAVAQQFLRRGGRTRRQLQARVETMVRDLRDRQEFFKRKQQKIAHNLNKRLRDEFLSQQERLVLRSQQMARLLQSGRSRAWTPKIYFAFVQLDFVITAYWLGASPETFYRYYTAQMLVIGTCKVCDYRVTCQHYFLFDFCYFANLCVLTWLWLMPTSARLFNAAEAFCGLLAISVVAFRNSCVPHDFVRISNAYVHYPAVIVVLSIKLRCEGDFCIGMQVGQALPWYMRVLDAWMMYVSWAVIYVSVIFVFCSGRIDRKKRDTLYNYFAVDLGYKEKLPKKWQPFSPVFFMAGHMTLFAFGVWWIFLPSPLQVVGATIAIIVFFHNGGRYYVDHFWKTYERNTMLYVDAASAAMSQVSETARREGNPSANANGTARPSADEQGASRASGHE
eukprot:TRINITY_DN20986_c0_g1_i1.p1 TRINITY_DN20986_c0_g1~~TRINITY_DN20986_c0_g1_i1.p1  ORF type:complete len:462 (-),score=58.98 TRINITY_DN20986_c0_g1_i1:103-1488(-)